MLNKVELPVNSFHEREVKGYLTNVVRIVEEWKERLPFLLPAEVISKLQRIHDQYYEIRFEGDLHPTHELRKW